jgi:hypothetical protein
VGVGATSSPSDTRAGNSASRSLRHCASIRARPFLGDFEHQTSSFLSPMTLSLKVEVRMAISTSGKTLMQQQNLNPSIGLDLQPIETA